MTVIHWYNPAVWLCFHYEEQVSSTMGVAGTATHCSDDSLIFQEETLLRQGAIPALDGFNYTGMYYEDGGIYEISCYRSITMRRL